MSKKEKASANNVEPHPYFDEEAIKKETRIRNLFNSLDQQTIHSYVKNVSSRKENDKIHYEAFKAHMLSKEEELWRVFSSINQKGDHRLTHEELQIALKESGIHATNSDIDALVQFIDTSGNGYIDFESWRNFLLLLPHEPTLTEIYRYYEMSTQLNADAEAVIPHTDEAARYAYKYLTAGAIAGCVSRTCTAPLDRLKIHLITNTNYHQTKAACRKTSSIMDAIKTIYKNGGFRGLYVGNGLNVIKIIPESAIKFYVFETSKAFMAQMTSSSDKNSIPVGARFIAGGVAGLCSQFCVYPLETLKTRIMSSQRAECQKLQIQQRRPMIPMRTVVKEMYRSGGVKAFWPGLVLSMLGVFPYQALDMGIYETLKVSYLRSMDNRRVSLNEEKPEPNVMILWMCGMMSGSIGATSVYPLNMIRTRLQAQGTPAHPYRYTSAWDVARKTYKSDGIRGFYKGLGPTLIKVVPSISISYAVYELSKRSLGVS
ncbi:MAG: mitochondrial carrier domain-containing protein [Benjaminiella poitrasii]|nr:MAG: mitochondrial carrier domain-containing protein [Benjaminiella poitrasii]